LENVAWLAVGLAALLVGLFACLVLLRLHRTLSILEETLLTAEEAIREVVPEVRGSLSNVNDISAGVNVVLRSAGGGASRLSDAAADSSRGASAVLYGARVTAASLWRTFTAPVNRTGGQPHGK
jgi:hypothetical protein